MLLCEYKAVKGERVTSIRREHSLSFNKRDKAAKSNIFQTFFLFAEQNEAMGIKQIKKILSRKNKPRGSTHIKIKL